MASGGSGSGGDVELGWLESGARGATTTAKKRSLSGSTGGSASRENSDFEQDTDRLLGARGAQGDRVASAFTFSSNPGTSSFKPLTVVRSWWRGPKTWRSLVGFAAALVMYVYLVSVVNTPRQLYPETTVRFCPYLDVTNIERRRSSLPPALQNVPLRVGLVTFFGNLDPDVRAASIKNKQDYANRHSYEVIVADDEIDKSRPAAWSKFPILEKYLPEYDYLMWVDADAIFMNMTIRVEDIVDAEHDLFFARDEGDINSGVFLVRNTDWAMWWLKEAWSQTWLITGSHPFKYEQRAIHYLYGTDGLQKDARRHNHELYPRVDEVRGKTAVVPYCAFNSNICEEFWTGLALFRRIRWPGWFCDNIYANGDFIIHFAGKSPASWRNWLFLKFAELADTKNNLV
ncbi:Xyloglucan 6-xylosyltransferase 1 [Hondaea fermentalgiana]|uniref:Xyloglucan 6-xylosyltransferase 1 n=1 Tax=Hondaea fermentalgiana TaxID=2315210 RepID=A0A2R5GV14_9STRA|nr:Xyloglucan 6-xylosyltransferase 1 [Hondaea fermentalgiana]|eukprot:GBG34405.1 Xyloglucan 6-xylosyltransferase 1 [Hondaea fermentalgiana]